MTTIHSSTIPNNQHNFYRTKDNQSQSVIDTNSSINKDELDSIIDEIRDPLKKEIQYIKNLLKDATQKTKQQDNEISYLKEKIQVLTETLNKISINKTPSPPIKNNIFYSRHESDNVIIRTHGLGGNSERGRYAKNPTVMLEFVSKFPQKFDLDIKGYFTKGIIDKLPEDAFFKVKIGKDGKEIRHTETFKLFKRSRDYATVEFITDNEDNNTIWIEIPQIPQYSGSEDMIYAGLDLHVLNIIPR